MGSLKVDKGNAPESLEKDNPQSQPPLTLLKVVRVVLSLLFGLAAGVAAFALTPLSLPYIIPIALGALTIAGLTTSVSLWIAQKTFMYILDQVSGQSKTTASPRQELPICSEPPEKSGAPVGAPEQGKDSPLEDKEAPNLKNTSLTKEELKEKNPQNVVVQPRLVTEQDLGEAEIAAEVDGDLRAQLGLGAFYLQKWNTISQPGGRPTAEEKTKCLSAAKKYYELAAEQEDAQGLMGLGRVFKLQGNVDEAVKNYAAALEQGAEGVIELLEECSLDSLSVEYILGKHYLENGDEQKIARGLEHLSRAVRAGNQDALHLLRAKAESGCCYAAANLADFYYKGEGEIIPQDQKSAFKWYQVACKSTDSILLGYVKCQLGHCYFNGYGVEKNEVLAISHYQESSHQEAQYQLGLYYESTNQAEAMDYYKRAQGVAEARYHLGVCYIERSLCDQDLKEELGQGLDLLIPLVASGYLAAANLIESKGLISQSPNHGVALGNAYMAQGKYEQAGTNYNIAIASTDKEVVKDASYKLGSCLLIQFNNSQSKDLMQLQEAIRFFCRAAQLGHQEALEKLNHLAVTSSEYRFKWALALGDLYSEGKDSEGNGLDLDYVKAKNYYNIGLGRNPENYLKLGDLAQKEGQFDTALSNWFLAGIRNSLEALSKLEGLADIWPDITPQQKALGWKALGDIAYHSSRNSQDKAADMIKKSIGYYLEAIAQGIENKDISSLQQGDLHCCLGRGYSQLALLTNSPDDTKRALAAWEKSVQLGYCEAYLELGDYYLSQLEAFPQVVDYGSKAVKYYLDYVSSPEGDVKKKCEDTLKRAIQKDPDLAATLQENVFNRNSTKQLPVILTSLYPVFKQIADEHRMKEAEYFVGVCGFKGYGLKGVDRDLALTYYKRAADQGLGVAAFYAGALLTDLDNPQEAFTYYQKAVEHGHAKMKVTPSIRKLAEVSESKGDFVRALEYYKAAVAYDDYLAMVRLGRLYKTGVAGKVEANPKEAVKLFKKSAKGGCALGQRELAVCYEKGIGVDAARLVEAAELFKLAARELQA